MLFNLPNNFKPIVLVLSLLTLGLFFFQNFQQPGLRLGDGDEHMMTMTRRSELLLEKKCGDCHGHPTQGRGGISSIGSSAALIRQGLVIPGDPTQSALIKVLTKSTDHRNGEPFTEEETQLLRDWIATL